MHTMIDFRSDTVTKPSQEMREQMAKAPVGDDVFGEDPTVNELENYAAALFGFEKALFCASGTQTNQIAINVHCKPGDEVICAQDAHIYKYEGGGIARNSGTSVRLIEGNRGRLTVEEIEPWINNPDDVHYPLTALVSLEDTMNRGGGAIYNFDEIKKIKGFCDAQKLPLHLDGARLFNALVETGVDYKKYGVQFDSISICLSKGLGAPVGSILLGNSAFIKKAHRSRKAFGGGMRQAGIIAQGGLYALKNNISRLKEDHKNAKAIEQELVNNHLFKNVIPVETNIVVGILKEKEKLPAILDKLKQKHILSMPFGPGMIRFVTHLDISKNQIDETLEVIKKL